MTDYLYPNAVVYRINVGDEFYIGSTVDMRNRFYSHKCYLKMDCQYKLYKKMREYNLDFDDVEISILQTYPCNDKSDLRRREGIYQKELKPTLNDFVAGRTKQEYRVDNKEHMIEYEKERYEKNKTENLENKKIYYIENKDAILAYKREKKECEYCHKEITRNHLSRHYKTCPDKPSSSS